MNIWRSVLRRTRDDKGQSLVIVALAFVVLCGMVGLTFDIGNGYMQKQNLQAAVDAGALAGAQSLMNGSSSTDQTAAQTTAMKTAKTNVNTAQYTAQTTSNSVTVGGTHPVSTFFVRILGVNTMTVRATATAEIGPLAYGNGIVPIGVTAATVKAGQDDPTKLQTLTGLDYPPGNGNGGSGTDSTAGPGNFGYLNLNSDVHNPGSAKGGGKDFESYMQYGASFPISVNDSINTKTGESVGLVKPAIDWRLESQNNAAATCSAPSTANDSCARVVKVPVVQSLDVNGSKPVTVTGFAEFYLVSYTDKSISGYFISTLNAGTINADSTQNYGALAVQLIH